MSRAKSLVREYLSGLEAGGAKWARRTEFKVRADGSVLRRITRADGVVEKSAVIPRKHAPVAAARAATGLSQAQFAKLLGVSKRTLEGWEQGRMRPSGAARVLLKIAARRPEVVKEAASS